MIQPYSAKSRNKVTRLRSCNSKSSNKKNKLYQQTNYWPKLSHSKLTLSKRSKQLRRQRVTSIYVLISWHLLLKSSSSRSFQSMETTNEKTRSIHPQAIEGRKMTMDTRKRNQQIVDFRNPNLMRYWRKPKLLY